MKITTMLRKIALAMDLGHPDFPHPRWDRARSYVERLLLAEPDLDHKTRVYDQLLAIVDSEPNGTINLCSSPDQSPRYYVAFRVNTVGGEHLFEARADDLLACLTSIAQQTDALTHV